jgi:hypothetical protein
MQQMQLVAKTGHPDFLDLPWGTPLEKWESERFVEVVRGIGRHVVRFVDYDGALYALKELPERLAWREYRLLGQLADQSIPVVEAVGVVANRPSEDGQAVLITRYLDFSLPYRTLFTGRGVPDLRNRLLDSLADLLVRLHLAGFFWGDCSLSNALFRRDAGALTAYIVDAETGEIHPELSEGQRRHDLELANENIAGELMDLEVTVGFPPDLDPVETAGEICSRYEALWTEVTREEVFGPDERYRVDDRLHRLNELGFDVEEVELRGDDHELRLRVTPQVVEPGHHQRRLLMLTGLHVQENQARRMLNDLYSFRAYLERKDGRQLPEPVVAHRWLVEVYEAALAQVPADLRPKLEPAEIFHEILEHRWYLSEEAGRDVGLDAAVRSYVETVLRSVPDERTVLSGDLEPEEPDLGV